MEPILNRNAAALERYQAAFAWKALKDGWSVSLNGDGELVLSKDKNQVPAKDLGRMDFSRKLLETYTQGLAGGERAV